MYTILPFQDEYIPAAAELLKSNFLQLRVLNPLLPERLNDLSAATSALEHLWQKPDAHGALILQDDRLAAYLLCAYSENVFFGKHVWVPLGGLGMTPDLPPESFARLYQAAGDTWVADGVLNHYIVSPNLQPWLEAAFNQSFGKEQAHALCSMEDLPSVETQPPGIEIRQVKDGDQDILASVSDWITVHLNKGPVWEPVPQEQLDRNLKGYTDLATEEDSQTWLAFSEDRIVGYAVFYAAETGPGDLLGSTRTIEFTAATHADFRGRGINRALLARGFNTARQAGYTTCLTDWRTTNIAANRRWLGLGFEPVAYRLLRRVNPRYKPH